MKTTKKVAVNLISKEITINKAFARKAETMGTPEFEELKKAIQDFPQFSIKVKAPQAREKDHKGLTKDLMKKLVKEMSDNNQADIKKFNEVIALYEGTNFHFSKVKAYFLVKYPAYKDFLAEDENQVQETAAAITSLKKVS